MGQITRRGFLAGGAVAALPGQTSTSRPNVILIMTDDQGHGDFSFQGNPHVKTPHLDALARDAVRFTRFYVSPVCAPTRSSLLTGRYNVRCGVHGVTGGRETLSTEEVTLAEALKGGGYRTALIGKWHLGEHYPYVPHAQGFDEFIGFRTGHWMNYFDSPLERNGKPYRAQGYITDAFTSEAIRFVDANRRGPFFLYLAYNAPHSPFQVPESYHARFRDRDLPPETKAVYAMVENLDDNIGRLLGALQERGLAENTIVLFLTDNGPNGKRYNNGLRAAKSAVYEGGVRTPLLVRWPGKLAGGRTVDRLAGHIDVYPTVLDLCGVAAPKGPKVDGRSLAPLLRGDGGTWSDRMFFTHQARPANPTAPYPGAVRTQRWSLINGQELYDLEADPGETKDVAATHAETARELRAAYEQWFRDALAERGFQRYPIPVGYGQERPVVLPATQAYLHGGLVYHGGPGYAHDWIEKWTSVDQRVHWELDIVRAGEYDVSLRYLCPAESLGAKIVISAGAARAEAEVREATPMERIPNPAVIKDSGYPEMRWGTLKLGRMTLPKGKVNLDVRAAAKPGSEVLRLKEAILAW